MNVQDNNRVPQLLRELQRLQNTQIEVGVFESDSPEKLMIARVHEYGVQIDVTDAMRGYLAHIGYPLKRSTEHINIPERSFIRSTFDEEERHWNQLFEKGISKVLKGNLTFQQLMDRMGRKMVSDIQDKIRDLDQPPNADMTRERKGSSNPLIDEGSRGGLISKINYKVVT